MLALVLATALLKTRTFTVKKHENAILPNQICYRPVSVRQYNTTIGYIWVSVYSYDARTEKETPHIHTHTPVYVVRP